MPWLPRAPDVGVITFRQGEMIESFRDSDTEATFHGKAVRRIPPDVRTRARRIVGIPVGTVMSRLFRGRRLLQERLFGYAVETGVLHPTLDAAKEGREQPLSLDDYRKRRARA